MPFSGEFGDVYQIGIKEACDAAGAYCERVDEQIFTETVLERIYNQIAKADLIVADMTGRNPNVFYEVGYAHALNQRTILLTKNADDIPFDLKHFPHIVYGDSLAILREELTRRIKWHVANPPGDSPDSHINIDLYLGSELIGSPGVIHGFPHGRYPHFPVTIHNNSIHTFISGEFKIGIITPLPFTFIQGTYETTTTTLPDGRLLHMLPVFDILFPNSYDSFDLYMGYSEENFKKSSQYKIIFRVFTTVGTRDFECFVKYLGVVE